MTVLVTGGAGFAGQHLLACLVAGGAGEIVAATLDGEPPEHGPAVGLQDVRWVPMDVTDPRAVRETVAEIRPERIFHLAAQSSVGASFRDPLSTWTVNATGFLHLVDAADRLRPSACRILLVSSAEVYGAVPERDQPIREDRALAPLTPYGASKAAAEMIAMAATRSSDLEVVVARSFNHTGPGQHRRFALPSFASQLAVIAEGDAAPVLHTGNLGVSRDFLDVRDVVAGYRLIMERGTPGIAYNVASGIAHPLSDLVVRLVEVSGMKAEIREDRDRHRPVDIPVLAGDPSRLEDLGWIREHDLDDTLRGLYAGVKKGWT